MMMDIVNLSLKFAYQQLFGMVLIVRYMEIVQQEPIELEILAKVMSLVQMVIFGILIF